MTCLVGLTIFGGKPNTLISLNVYLSFPGHRFVFWRAGKSGRVGGSKPGPTIELDPSNKRLQNILPYSATYHTYAATD